MSLTDQLTRAPREDVFELASVQLWIPTDEQLAKSRARFENAKAHAQLRVAWKPKTYQKFIGDDEVTEEVDYFRMTKGDGIPEGLLESIREAGYTAIPNGILLTLPASKKADPDKQTSEFQRFMLSAAKAGIVIDIDDNGQFFSPQVGKLYRCRDGAEEFPKPNIENNQFKGWDWDDPRLSFMRVPIAEVTDFEQPAELAQRRYERKETAEAGEATTTTSAPAELGSADITAAFASIGIGGKPVAVVNASAVSLVVSNVAKFPAVFGAKEVQAAAQSGKLVDYLVERGAATVIDGVVNVG